MRLCLAFVSSLLACSLSAQNTVGVADVGLTMSQGTSTGTVNSVVGQICGPFTCVPFQGPSLTTNSLARTVRVYGDANSLYVLLMSVGPVAQPCVSFPGIGNALILGQPLATLAFGVLGPYQPSTSIACRQGVGTYQLNLPVVSPAPALTFRLQALTFSHTTQGPAFTVAVQGVAR